MEQFLNLVLPFISTPKSYEDMLKKLASFAGYETYLITLLLRANPTVDGFFSSIEQWGPIGKVVDIIPHHEVLNLSGVVIALAMAFLTHMFQFHDRISDLLGIRRRFDYRHILLPLSQRVGSPIGKDKEATVRKNRDRLMGAVFYKYASSRSPAPLVDRHNIEHALSAWSWFWVLVEGIVYFGIGAIIAWCFGSLNLVRIFAVTAAVLLIIAFAQRARLGRYARPQIDNIVADPTAAADIKRVFDAI